MINLQELEKEIDALLNSETPETLKKWLSSQNKLDIHSYLGEGSIINSSCNVIHFVDNTPHAEILLPTENDKVDSGNNYQMAA